MSELKTVFKGEMQLMNWGESSSNGAWVKFWITPEDLEAFRHLKTRSGKIAGHRMAVMMVEIGEDETPAQESNQVGRRCIEAAELCKQPRFQEYVATKAASGSAVDEELAKEYVLLACNLDSRKELDASDAAWGLFVSQVRAPYFQWLRKRGE